MVTASQRLQNAWKVLAGTDTLLTHPLRGMRRAVQAFYKRFSGQERAPVSDRQGADARRDATSGQFVCFRCPGAGALDHVNEVRILEGQLTVIARVSQCFRVTQRRYLNGCERDLARLSKDVRGAARGRQAEASRPQVPKSWRCFVSGSEAPRSPVTRWENTASGLRSRDRG